MDIGLLVAVVAGILFPASGGVWYLSGRLASIEGNLSRMSQKIDSQHDIIQKELTMNGGRSVKDTVIRLDERINGPAFHRWDDPDGTPV